MILQIGPAKVEISIDDGATFSEAFASSEANITHNFQYRDRVNDGVVVESAYESATLTFELNATEWSIDVLKALFPFSYSYTDAPTGVPRTTRSHLFDLGGLTEEVETSNYTQCIVFKNVPTCWIKFTPNVTGKAIGAEIPKARFAEELSIPFAPSQEVIPIKGIGMKSPNQSLLLIWMNQCIIL